MTLTQFKTWFAGFSEAVGSAPNISQWERVKKEIAAITPDVDPSNSAADAVPKKTAVRPQDIVSGDKEKETRPVKLPFELDPPFDPFGRVGRTPPFGGPRDPFDPFRPNDPHYWLNGGKPSFFSGQNFADESTGEALKKYGKPGIFEGSDEEFQRMIAETLPGATVIYLGSADTEEQAQKMMDDFFDKSKYGPGSDTKH